MASIESWMRLSHWHIDFDYIHGLFPFNFAITRIFRYVYLYSIKPTVKQTYSLFQFPLEFIRTNKIHS